MSGLSARVRGFVWRERWLLLMLLALVLTRVPLWGQYLYHWDSVSFAFALDEVNIAEQKPYTDAYVPYVLAGRLFRVFTGDGASAFLLMNLVLAAVALLFLYKLAREMSGERAARYSALFLLFSPLFWFFNNVVFYYTAAAAFPAVAVWFLWRSVKGGGRWELVAAALCLGLGAGFRFSTSLFLLPVCLYLSFRGERWRGAFLFLALFGGSAAAWYTLVMWHYDTWGWIFRFGSVLSNSNLLFWKYPSRLPGFVLLLLLSPAPGAVFFAARGLFRSERKPLFFLWLFPPLLFFGLVYYYSGYLVELLVPLCLLAGAALAALPPRRGAIFAAGFALLSCLAFFAPRAPRQSGPLVSRAANFYNYKWPGYFQYRYTDRIVKEGLWLLDSLTAEGDVQVLVLYDPTHPVATEGLSLRHLEYYRPGIPLLFVRLDKGRAMVQERQGGELGDSVSASGLDYNISPGRKLWFIQLAGRATLEGLLSHPGVEPLAYADETALLQTLLPGDTLRVGRLTLTPTPVAAPH